MNTPRRLGNTKRAKVLRCLANEPRKSDRRIAALAGVSHVTVGKIRAQYPEYQTEYRWGKDGKTRRRSTSGMYKEIMGALRNLEKKLAKLRAATGTGAETAAKEKARQLLIKAVQKINTTTEPFMIPPKPALGYV